MWWPTQPLWYHFKLIIRQLFAYITHLHHKSLFKCPVAPDFNSVIMLDWNKVFFKIDVTSTLLQNKFLPTTVIAMNTKWIYENECLKESFFLTRPDIYCYKYPGCSSENHDYWKFQHGWRLKPKNQISSQADLFIV